MGNRSKVYRLAVAVFFFVSGVAVTAYGGERAVYGPEVFAREKGMPQKVVKTFTVPNPKWEYSLAVESKGISSAIIEINGVRIIGPNDFNKQVEKITKSVELQKQNEIAVELRSEPGTSIVVTVKGFPVLPPDPGEAGKLTLEGIDSDNDGIRDDIQRYIVLTYPDDEAVQEALRQLVRVGQDFLLHSDDKEQAINIAAKRGRAMECIYYHSLDDAYDMIRNIKPVILNTEERTRAYIAADSLLGGETFHSESIENWSKSCGQDF